MLDAIIKILTAGQSGTINAEQAAAIKEQQELEQRQIKRLRSFFVASVVATVVLSAFYIRKKVNY